MVSPLNSEIDMHNEAFSFYLTMHLWLCSVEMPRKGSFFPRFNSPELCKGQSLHVMDFAKKK
jgi:ferritin